MLAGLLPLSALINKMKKVVQMELGIQPAMPGLVEGTRMKALRAAAQLFPLNNGADTK